MHIKHIRNDLINPPILYFLYIKNELNFSPLHFSLSLEQMSGTGYNYEYQG
jgi:hypothetical protein